MEVMYLNVNEKKKRFKKYLIIKKAMGEMDLRHRNTFFSKISSLSIRTFHQTH